MKIFKKGFCIFLSFVILCAVMTISATAAASDEDAVEQAFRGYLGENGDFVVPEATERLAAFMLVSNGFHIFWSLGGEPLPSAERIGKYIFYTLDRRGDDYPVGIYAEKDGQVLPLCKAYEQDLIDLDEIAAWCKEPHDRSFPEVYSPGDTDRNGTVEVSDVLYVQKVIAKIEDMEPFFSSFQFCDFDGNKLINVTDVLGMQKHIAKAAPK